MPLVLVYLYPLPGLYSVVMILNHALLASAHHAHPNLRGYRHCLCFRYDWVMCVDLNTVMMDHHAYGHAMYGHVAFTNLCV